MCQGDTFAGSDAGIVTGQSLHVLLVAVRPFAYNVYSPADAETEPPKPDAGRLLALARVEPAYRDTPPQGRQSKVSKRLGDGPRPSFRPGQSRKSDVSAFVLTTIQKAEKPPIPKDRRPDSR